jgi:hypothetical protein
VELLGEHTDRLIQLLSWFAMIGGATLVALRLWSDRREADFRNDAAWRRRGGGGGLDALLLPHGSTDHSDDRMRRAAQLSLASIHSSRAPPGLTSRRHPVLERRNDHRTDVWPPA